MGHGKERYRELGRQCGLLYELSSSDGPVRAPFPIGLAPNPGGRTPQLRLYNANVYKKKLYIIIIHLFSPYFLTFFYYIYLLVLLYKLLKYAGWTPY
jgi:hypothetical protein